MPLMNVLATDTSSSAGFDTVLDAATKLVAWGGELLQTIVENPILVVFVAASFVTVGLGIVTSLKSTAKG